MEEWEHPDYYERMAFWADMERKRRRENGEVSDLLADAERRSMGRSMPFRCSEDDVDESGGVA